MTKILVTGGTGLVGRHLCRKLLEKGYEVAVLGRTRHRGNIPAYIWNLEKKEIEKDALHKVDCIIHLAGAGIAEKRWTSKRRQMIVDSRVNTGKLILKEIQEKNHHLKVFISASGVGYYGQETTDHVFEEDHLPGNGFLAETCVKWEQMANGFNEIGIRTVLLRTGVVLAGDGGALSKMMKAVKLGIGSAIGTGCQYMPWIHIDDLCGVYIKAIEDTGMKGAYNAVSPDHKTNKEFTRTLAKVLKKPFWFPNIPAFVLRILLGKMSELLLNGSRVSADKIGSAGYIFLYPNLERAMDQIICEFHKESV